MKILHVVGARPNFPKVAPVVRELARRGEEQVLVHTGQHYDERMSQVFFEELGLARPDLNLEVGAGSHAVQTAEVMRRFEPVVVERRPDWVTVYGDVNSTVAAALVCAKLGVRTAHVEAGLRSFDRTMPEELNRLVTDQLADLLLTPSADADENLAREGIPGERIRRVGNVMIDTLVAMLPRAEAAFAASPLAAGGRYVVVTLHRPANVDRPEVLAEILAALDALAGEVRVLFPVHPRSRERLAAAGWSPRPGGIELLEPLGYLEFLGLEANAALAVTDSGGVQEETTWLGVPCLTVRPNTERPITVTAGTNRLVEARRGALLAAARDALARGRAERHAPPPLWDGRAAERIADALQAAR